MLDFERGSKDNPTGNLILYCNVIGENPVPPGGGIIASNVVVSALKVGDNFPVVTFPPVALPSVYELRAQLEPNIEAYDIIRLPDFELPEKQEEVNAYIQMQMERYNQVVLKYVEYCKKKHSSESKIFFQPVENLSVNDYLELLTVLSSEYRVSDGKAKESVLNKLDQVVEKFSSQHPEYDLVNFKRALRLPGNQGEKLIHLYLQKFNAISTENYEDASKLKKEIEEIETSLSGSL